VAAALAADDRRPLPATGEEREMEAGTITREPRRAEVPQARVEQRGNGVARVLPITADPAPLGLGAFALTTFVLSIFNAGLVSSAGEPVVLGLAFAYGGLAQLLAGMWEFRTGNTFGAVAFTSYGAFWLSFGAFAQFFEGKVPAAHLPHSIGLFLIAWGIFTTYMWVASFRVSVAVNLVFLALAVTFFLLGIGNAADSPDIVKAGGYAGIATAVLAWYASFAGVIKSTFGREVLPLRELKR
jgi:succinate-acetate transporter protein